MIQKTHVTRCRKLSKNNPVQTLPLGGTEKTDNLTKTPKNNKQELNWDYLVLTEGILVKQLSSCSYTKESPVKDLTVGVDVD